MEVLDGGRAWFKCPGPKGMVLGEAPIYRPQDTTLHWVNCLSDPPEIHILQLDPNTGNPTSSTKDAHRILPLTDSVSVAFFRKDKPGSYICAYHQGIAFLDERSGALEVVKEIIPTADREIRRFNDGGIDAKGRFWLAEIDRKAMAYGPRNLPADYGEPIGRLWRYEPDGSLHQMETGIVCGNGLAWSPDNKTMYFNDSVSLVMYAYDFDLETGNISSKRIFIDRRQTYGEPDGMVVDGEGNIWVAMWDTYRVMVFNPDGVQIKDIKFSSKRVTCPTWGGRDLATLYVTSAVDQTGSDEADEGGHVFRYDPTWPKFSRGTQKIEFAG